jgi:hypothetical protein
MAMIDRGQFNGGVNSPSLKILLSVTGVIVVVNVVTALFWPRYVGVAVFAGIFCVQMMFGSLDRSFMAKINTWLEITKPGGAVAKAVEAAQEELAEVQARVDSEIEALRGTVTEHRQVADELEAKVDHYRNLLALTKLQAEVIGQFLTEFQAKRARRDLWIGVACGALLSVPIGILVNLLTK